jgi:hypothetical protein
MGPFMERETESSGDAADADPQALARLIEVIRLFPKASRLRAVDAALTFLGETREPPRSRGSTSGNSRESFDLESEGDATVVLSRRAQAWLAQNGLTGHSLEHVFHRTPLGVELIAHQLPGATNKERVLQCYLLTGARALIASGEPRFTDDDARAVCKDLGYYDQDNHAHYLKAIRNMLAGSKIAGFELTQPGLRAAADLIKRIAPTPP